MFQKKLCATILGLGAVLTLTTGPQAFASKDLNGTFAGNCKILIFGAYIDCKVQMKIIQTEVGIEWTQALFYFGRLTVAPSPKYVIRDGEIFDGEAKVGHLTDQGLVLESATQTDRSVTTIERPTQDTLTFDQLNSEVATGKTSFSLKGSMVENAAFP